MNREKVGEVVEKKEKIGKELLLKKRKYDYTDHKSVNLSDYDSIDYCEEEEEEPNSEDLAFIDNTKYDNNLNYNVINQMINENNINNNKNNNFIKKIDAKTLGIVIYGDKKMYSDILEENKDIHFKNSKEIILWCLLRSLMEMIGDKNIHEVVVGHEHGDSNNKCHMQIYIKFNERLQFKLKPSYFEYKEEKFLYMAQSAKRPEALRLYCMKDNDYLNYIFDQNISTVLNEKNMLHNKEIKCIKKTYNALFNEFDLDEDEIIELFKKGNINDKRDLLIYGKKILENYNRYIKQVNTDLKFEWKFPKYMLDFINEIHTESKLNKKMLETYKLLYKWFKDYCLGNEYDRKKALFLFSLEGGKGKSYFARNLVPQIKEGESPFYVYCRGTLDGKEFDKKKETARLIIIDDVNYISKDIEIWKALSVGEPTNIRTPYYNDMWLKRLPCIILSNNFSTFKYWIKDDSMKSRCIFVTIDFYIGAPGTYNSEMDKIYTCITDDVKKKLDNPFIE